MKYTVPLTGNMNTRISQSNAVAASSGIVGIGIVGIMIVGLAPSSADKDEKWINCYMTKMGGREYIMKRPGYAALNTPSAGNVGSSLMIWSGSGGGTSIVAAFGATNSTVYIGGTGVGAITGKSRNITETTIGGTATLLSPSGDSTAWYYDTGVAVMTKITDGDFPGNAGYTTVGDFADISGFNCIMTSDGKIWAPNLNSVTGWTANNYDSANSYPDQGIGCVRFRNMLMAFGSQSIEFWQNAGLPLFPLQRSQNMTQKVGAIHSEAIATLSDNVFWCGSTDRGGLSIYHYDGSLARISTAEIDAQLALTGPSNISLTTERKQGRSFVLVIANATTYVYCLEDKRWHTMSSTTPLWGKCAGLSAGSQMLSYAISTVGTSGKVYVLNPANLVFTDDSVAYTATIQSAADDVDSPYTKTFPYLAAMADIEPATSTLTVYYSDDDYVTWTNAGTMDLSTAKPYLTSLGSSQRARAWKFLHDSNTAFRISRFLGDVTIGTT